MPVANERTGRVNQDDTRPVESGILLPWLQESSAGYLYYDCTVAVVLDSGIVIHNRLPQVDRIPDTLSSVDITDSRIAEITDLETNLNSRDDYEDIVQRMAHSRYWFRLFGRAMRIGYKVPIPGIRVIGGQKAIPHDKNPQLAFNTPVSGGNYGGVPLWMAGWSLWYTTARPPFKQDIHQIDLAGGVNGIVPLPREGIQSPYSAPDDNAVRSIPPSQAGFTTFAR